MVLRFGGAEVARVPIAPVSAPRRSTSGPTSARRRPAGDRPRRQSAGRAPRALLQLLGSLDLASKRWIFEQYDYMVMADTVVLPGGDAAVVRIHGSNRGLALTTDCTPRYCLADPAPRSPGGRRGVAQPLRGRRAAAALTDCLNFGSPRTRWSWASSSAAPRGHGGGLPGARLPGRLRQLFYNETDGQCCRPRRSAASG